MDKTNLFRKFSAINILIAYFIYASLFPSIRLLLLGSASSSGFWEVLFSLTPDLLLVASFAACFVQYREQLKWKNMNPGERALSVFLALSLCWGFFRSRDVLLSVQSIRLTYLPCIVYFTSRAISSGQEKKEWWKAIEIIFAVQLVLCVIGLVLYFLFPDVISFMMKRGNYFQSEYFFIRMTSILWNPIFFASVAAVSSLFYLWKYFQSNKLIALICYCICFASLILTVSRGAFVAFSVVYVLMCLWVFRGWKRVTTSIISFAIYVLLIYLLTGGFDIVNWFIKSTYATVSMEGNLSRVRLWDFALQNFLNNPWGNGLGKAGHVAHRYLSDSSSGASIYSTDGWYLKTANETGIPGILLFISFIGLYLYSFIKLKPHSSFQKLCFSIFIFVMIQNCVSNVLDFNYFAPLFWLVTGCTFSIVFKDDKTVVG